MKYFIIRNVNAVAIKQAIILVEPYFHAKYRRSGDRNGKRRCLIGCDQVSRVATHRFSFYIKKWKYI